MEEIEAISELLVMSGKLFGVRGEAKGNFWWGAQPQFADRQTSFEPSLPTNRIFLEFSQQYNVDEHH